MMMMERASKRIMA